MPALEAFFTDLDQAWTEPVEHPIALHLIGSTALMLPTSYQRGTKDSDVLETAGSDHPRRIWPQPVDGDLAPEVLP